MSPDPPSRRALYLLAALGTITPLAIDAYLPALPVIADLLGASLQVMESSVSTYMVGLSVGVLVGATVSDRLGRRPSVLAGLALFALCSVALAMTPNAGLFLSLRVVQAFGGGFAFVNIPAIIRDVYEEQDSARALTMVTVIALIAPLVAPLLGATILALAGWRAIFFVLAAYAIVLALLISLHLPETSRRRGPAPRGSVPAEIRANLTRVFRTPQAVALVVCQAAAFSVLFTFVADATFIYMAHYGLSPFVFAFLFSANIATLIAFNRANKLLLRYRSPLSIVPIASVFQVVACIGLVALVLAGATPLWLYVPLTMIAFGALGMIGPNVLARYMTHFGTGAGTASGVITCAQYLAAGLVSIASAALHDGTLLTPGATMLICALISAAALRAAQVLRPVPQVSGEP